VNKRFDGTSALSLWGELLIGKSVSFKVAGGETWGRDGPGNYFVYGKHTRVARRVWGKKNRKLCWLEIPWEETIRDERGGKRGRGG